MINNLPLVSIIIPVYNGSNYIREAIDSALAQTYKNIEIIVVNDGSLDGGATEEIVLSYGEKIKYIKKENGGCASAINCGIKNSVGEYIAWLSHDDLYYREKIEYQINLYDLQNLDKKNTIISNRGALIDSTRKNIYHPTYGENGFFCANEIFDYLLFVRCLNGCGLLIPKQVFDKGGYFREDMRFVLDWNLWLKFAICGVDFYLDEKILVSNRQHSMQVTNKQKLLHKTETNETIKEIFGILKTSQKHLLVSLYKFAYINKNNLTKTIRAYIKENGIKYNRGSLEIARIKSILLAIIKKAYRFFVRIKRR